LNILLLSRYGPRGASSRVRFYQYVPALEAAGHSVTVAPFFDDDYLDRLYAARPRAWGNIVNSYVRRMASARRGADADLVWLEGEAFPWWPAALERVFGPRRPFVVDYDDAAFHRYDRHRFFMVRAALSRKIDAVMRRAALVVAGNDYIADRARRAGARRVERLPSVVDTDRFAPAPGPRPSRPFTVGWVGTPSTQKYLAPFRDVFRALCAEGGARLVLVGARLGADLPPEAEVRPWSEAGESAELQSLDAGVMPLPDDPWTRGKCGYKLIQYGAAGLPVVASPVGVNTEIVSDRETGFLAEGATAWLEALRRLRDDAGLRDRLGRAGRARVEERYSLRSAAPVLLRLLTSVARAGG